MRIISCCTRLHATTTRISLFRHNHHHKLTPSSARCFSHNVSLSLHCNNQPLSVKSFLLFSVCFSQDCSVSRHQMEQLDLSANTVIDHPRALTDKTTLIRDAGPSKFQVFPSLSLSLSVSLSIESEVFFFHKAFKSVLFWVILGYCRLRWDFNEIQSQWSSRHEYVHLTLIFILFSSVKAETSSVL